MTAAELDALATEKNENPYSLAYALATGATGSREALARDGNGTEYIIWINERWRETKARIGRTFDPDKKHDAHMETLAGTIPSPLPLGQQTEMFPS